ncbi:reverse transcriptase domain-containing protein [Nitrobacter sp. JJSN]|uniref:reverse transcriptase domain-containing protein n=1 Tax=Nitrobacter sp. JJSN TaxID=3453033 RepID=UPI003F75A458
MDLKKTYDLSSLGALLGCSSKQLGYYIYRKNIASQYKYFEIAKRSGDRRKIRAPATNLKIIQKNLARELNALFNFRSSVTGFVKGRNIERNASMHVGQRHILNIDLQDFFPTINYGRIFGLLSKAPHNIAPKVAAAIAKACTLDNELPQGAPTSPVLSNLVCAKMDAELSRFAAANKCVYSRYADDMTFSTNRQLMPLSSLGLDAEGRPQTQVAKALRDIVEENGFVINEKKSRLTSRARRQVVTGLVVNKRVNVRRSYIREVRAMLFVWKKFGLDAAQKEFDDSYRGNGRNFQSVLRGRIEFIGQIRGRPDAVYKRLALQFNQLVTGGKIRTELSPSEIAAQAVWVLENDAASQGSAFFLKDVGIVSCEHCVGVNPYIYHHADHSKKFPLKLKVKDDHRDLAIFDIPPELKNVHAIPLHNGTALASGASIILLGYPNHFAARPVRIEHGTLIRTFPRSGVTNIEITAKIIEGNSGGPVLNDKYEVIGIATRGINASTKLQSAEFLAVHADELAKL